MCSKFISFIFRDFAVGVPVRLSSQDNCHESHHHPRGVRRGGRLRSEECRRQSALQRLSTSSLSSPSPNWPLANFDQQKIPLKKGTFSQQTLSLALFNLSLALFWSILSFIWAIWTLLIAKKTLFVLAGDIFVGSKWQTFRTQYFESNGFWDRKNWTRTFSGFNSASQNFAPQDPTLVMIWSL